MQRTKIINRLAGLLLIALLAIFTSAPAIAQTPAAAKKSYTFRGKVEGVNQKAGSLTVNGEDVPGWMAAMTMDYKVEDTAILKKVKVGDQIESTVYDSDMTLHNVKVTPGKAAKPAK